MYVCLCRAVTDGQISEAKSKGARSIKDLRAGFDMQICDQCCKCNSQIKKILHVGTCYDDGSL